MADRALGPPHAVPHPDCSAPRQIVVWAAMACKNNIAPYMVYTGSVPCMDACTSLPHWASQACMEACTASLPPGVPGTNASDLNFRLVSAKLFIKICAQPGAELHMLMNPGVSCGHQPPVVSAVAASIEQANPACLAGLVLLPDIEPDIAAMLQRYKRVFPEESSQSCPQCSTCHVTACLVDACW